MSPASVVRVQRPPDSAPVGTTRSSQILLLFRIIQQAEFSSVSSLQEPHCLGSIRARLPRVSEEIQPDTRQERVIFECLSEVLLIQPSYKIERGAERHGMRA